MTMEYESNKDYWIKGKHLYVYPSEMKLLRLAYTKKKLLFRYNSVTFGIGIGPCMLTTFNENCKMSINI